jgi:hypothetical protein
MARHASGGEPIRLESDLRELASGPFVLQPDHGPCRHGGHRTPDDSTKILSVPHRAVGPGRVQSELIESPGQGGIGLLVELTSNGVPPEQGQVSHRGRTRPVS